MKKIILAILGTIFALFIAGQIFVTNETLANFIFSIIYYGLNIIVILFFIFMFHILISVFGTYSHFSSNSGGINKNGFFILALGLVILILVLKYINSEEIKTSFNNLSLNISNHIEIEKGKMPIFHIGNTN